LKELKRDREIMRLKYGNSGLNQRSKQALKKRGEKDDATEFCFFIYAQENL
jgi:hypothetical protein